MASYYKDCFAARSGVQQPARSEGWIRADGTIPVATASPFSASGVVPPASGQVIRSDEKICIKRDVFAPLLAQCHWDARTMTWLLPEPQPDARLVSMDWSKMLHIPSESDITSVLPTFYVDEPDHNQRNSPRLDIVVSFTDGRSVRYHPSADPIWSDEAQPTEAMQQRYNRARKLAKKLQAAQPEV